MLRPRIADINHPEQRGIRICKAIVCGQCGSAGMLRMQGKLVRMSQAIQNLNQRIRDVEKDNIYEEYIKRVGEVIIGEILGSVRTTSS